MSGTVSGHNSQCLFRTAFFSGKSRYQGRMFLSDVAGLVSVDHLFNHLTAYGASLTRGEVAVVTVLKINSYFVGSFVCPDRW